MTSFTIKDVADRFLKRVNDLSDAGLSEYEIVKRMGFFEVDGTGTPRKNEDGNYITNTMLYRSYLWLVKNYISNN